MCTSAADLAPLRWLLAGGLLPGRVKSPPQLLSQLWQQAGWLCCCPPSWLVRLAIFHAELRKLESIGAQSSSLWAIFKL